MTAAAQPPAEPQRAKRTPSNQAAYDAHPADCGSLAQFKFFRPGGVCCMTCFDYCQECGDPFYVEGLRLDPRDPDEFDLLCDCCLRKVRDAV